MTCATAPPPWFAAGHDMRVIQETLGLSSITIAADTYTSVLPPLARQSAEDVAALIRPAAPPGENSPRHHRNRDHAGQCESQGRFRAVLN